MRRYLLGVGLVLLLGMALCDAIWPKPPELLIDAALDVEPAEPAPPEVLVAPCPRGPQNVPIVNPERVA